jgi:hypothetical protein
LKEMAERLLGTKGVLTGGIVPVAVPERVHGAH